MAMLASHSFENLAENAAAVLWLVIFGAIISLIRWLPGHLKRRGVEKRFDKAIDQQDLPVARQVFSELEEKYTRIIANNREAMLQEMAKKWTESGKKKVEREYLDTEQEWIDGLDEYREKVAALEQSLSGNTGQGPGHHGVSNPQTGVCC